MENSSIPIVGRFTVANIKWDEDEHLFILEDGTKYRAVILYGNREVDIRELDKTQRDDIVENVKGVFTESQFHFNDLDQVKISKNTLTKEGKVIALLDSSRVSTISMIFSRVIPVIGDPILKERREREEEEERATQKAIEGSKLESEIKARQGQEMLEFRDEVSKKHNLDYKKIDGTGDCLFEAAFLGLQKMKKEMRPATPSEFRKTVVAELHKNEYKEQIQKQIIYDLGALKEASRKGPDAWARELAYYQSPLRELYSRIGPLLQGIDVIDDFAIIESILSSEKIPGNLVESYLQTMEQAKVYGGQLELIAIQNLYQVPIHIFPKGNAQGYDIDRPYNQDNAEANLHLLFEGRHYDLFIPKSLSEAE